MKKNYFLLCLLSFSLSGLTMAQTDPGATNLKHQWTFADGTANDRIGTVNGTLMDGASIANGVLSTGGGYVELSGTDLAINTYTELTVSAWFKSEAGMNTSYHFLYYFGGQNGNDGANMTGYTPARGNDVSRAMIMTSDGEKGVNSTEFDDGVVHHMVCVIDAENISYYVDGLLIETASFGASSLAEISTDFAYFGKGGWKNDPNWTGDMDELSVYDKALTADNVAFLFNAGPIVVSGIDQAKKPTQNVYLNNGQVVAEFESSAASDAQIEVYDVQGKLLSSELFPCNAGVNQKTIKADFATGIYVVRLVVDGKSSYSKIAK